METNSFDRLVSGLSSGERKDLLDKMKSNTSESESLSSIDKYEQNSQVPFAVQIKNESIFYRFYLWIRALIANTSIEAIYNENKISEIARHVEKTSPHLIDNKKGLLLSTFYDKLNELSRCAEFFRPYIALIENDESAFLVFLGSFVMTDLEKVMDDQVDPYSLPVTTVPKPEQRMHLLRKMDQIMQEINASEKNSMYAAVRSLEWLKQFTKLPFKRFIMLFTSVTDNSFTCSYNALENEISSFAKILCNGSTIPEEVFEAMYLFSRRNTSKRSLDSMDEQSEKAKEFMDKAKSQISMMKMFITTVPMKSIGRIVYSDAAWMPGNFTGGEDWFQKYKATWRKLFDQKWEAWSHDCQKEILRQNLTHNFQLENFPLLPERPWKNLWGGVPFRNELTAGFLNWYMKDVFPTFEMILKTVMLEGDFVKKENRQEFYDSFNKLIQLSIDLQTLTRRLSAGGEHGIIFSKFMDEKLRTLQAHSKIETIIHGIEGDVRSMLAAFGDSARSLELCLSGIFNEKKDTRYESLTNLSHIGGNQHDKFMENLQHARESLSNCYAMIRELEPIDTPSLGK